ncbi:DUF3726 domain-containing protein [Dinoroseobacter sp. S76]|uniref:DUF3726 domain-containing protein n=1 Tax=Dinoroseobacter sp. S76 TaxID=3415124 RepID=UPI003C7C23D5
MTLSLNEVEAAARKATRGAGYPWGIAEDAGKATRWLCARGLDGCAALAEALSRFDGASLAEIAPNPAGAVWTAPAGELCPLMTGTTLSDHAGLSDHVGLVDAAELRLVEVAVPLLLLPFVASMAAQRDRCVTLTWTEGSAVTDGSDLSLATLPPPNTPWVTVAPGGALGAARLPRSSRATPAPEAWDTLNRFAHRTYAPATEESRRKGAGADTSNSD